MGCSEVISTKAFVLGCCDVGELTIPALFMFFRAPNAGILRGSHAPVAENLGILL